MSTRVRWTQQFPCPTCGGHSRMPRHQGRRCSGYLLKGGPGDSFRPIAYCSRVQAPISSPSGDLWAHPFSRREPAIVAPRDNSPEGARARTSKRWTIHHHKHAIAFHAYGGPHPFEVVRFDDEWRERGFPKSMPRHRNARGEWFTGAPPELASMTDAPLYRHDEAVLALEAGDPLYIVEGEADVDAIRDIGCAATSNALGALKWKPHHTAALASIESRSEIRIVRDCDKEGAAHAAHVYSSLWAAGIARDRLSILEAVQGKDTRDHLNAGFKLYELVMVPIRVRQYSESSRATA